MKRIFIIILLLLAIIFLIDIAHPIVFASDGGEITPTPTPTPSENHTCTPTPTPIQSGPTNEITPTVTGEPTVTPTPTVTPDPVTPTPTAPPAGHGDGLSDGRSDGLSSCPACTQAPKAQEQGEVLGASTMANTGTFEGTLMNIFAIFGMLLVTAGFASYAKEKKTI